jgi:DNA-binding transcriptional LysR family regulator
LNASVGFGTLALEPLLPAFWGLHPNIVVDLSLSDDIVDLYLDRTDLAFRVGNLPDSSLRLKKLGTARRVIVASPEYLARRGTPVDFSDLADHDCLGFNFRRSVTSWPHSQGGRIVEGIVRGSFIANNGESVRRMAVAGVGLARLADFAVRAELADGRLIEVLQESSAGDVEEVHALSVGARELPRRVRAFLDFAVPHLKMFIEGN